MTIAILTKILNGKYTYIVSSALLLILCITLTFKLIQNKVSFEKQKEFERKIENLEFETSKRT